MLVLYIKHTCVYCHKVLNIVATEDIELVTKDVNSDPAIMAELVSRGGKRQTPYLVDESAGVDMYESDDIIDYLRTNYTR